jgi:hypothetical protein
LTASTANINIQCKASKALLLVFAFIYLLALVSIGLISISVWLKIPLFLVVIYFGVANTKQYALLQNTNSVIKIVGASNGNCKIEFNDGKFIQAKIVSSGSLFEYFKIIVMKNNSQKITSIIAKDSISQEQFYVLRLYLRSLKY